MSNAEFLKLILDRLDDANTKIDLINKDTSEIVKVQAEQHIILAEHMRRTVANEKAIDIIAKELKPIQIHVAGIGLITKLFMWALGSSGLVYVILKSFFFHS